MRFHMDDAALAEYNSILNVTGNGIIGRIKIAKLNIEFPIYHTTRESVLQIAIGHIEGTSLPTGGTGTHCALSGHRVDNAKVRAKLHFTSDAELIDPMNVALTIGAPIILIWMGWMMLAPRKPRK